MKKNVFLSQVNYAYGSNVFLPFSVGLLEAYAKSFPEIRDAYTFLDLQYLRQPVADVVRDLSEPTLAGLSCYIWNWEYNQQLAQAIKQRWPECLVVLGGPQVPTRSAGFFQQYPWIDLLVHYEGEETFVALLLEMLQSKPEYTEIPGVSVRLPDVGCFSTAPRPRIQDLDKLVSPYLSGVFDRLLIHPYDFHASQETHRGCAYQCTFCQWGSSVFQKVRTFPSERLIEEFHWFGEHKIELVYNCIAEGTLVTTTGKRVPIEDLCSESRIVSYDEMAKCLSSSSVQMVLCSGIQNVWRVEHEQGYFDATEDHRVYTNHGWCTVGEMYSDIACQGCRKRESTWPESCYYKTRQWWRREENQCGERCAQEGALFACAQDGGWEQQLYEEDNPRGTKEACDENGDYQSSSWLFLEQTGKKRYQINRRKICLERENEALLGRSSMGMSSSSKGRPISKQIREEDCHISCRPQTPVQICRRLEFLDWALPIGYMSESRFCLWKFPRGGREKSSSNTCPRKILASESGFISTRTFGLSSSSLAVLCDLGRRGIGQNNGGQDSQIHWSPVRSINYLGSRRVYDLVNIEPNHNFFANGVLVSNCDANYGLFPRDEALTEALVETKRTQGFPKQFRAAYAKNSNDRVFSISKMLNDEGMSKGVTLSFQSVDETTLATIKRKNIGVKAFTQLMGRYHQARIPTYTELIMGLPGETYESFKAGLETLITAGQHDSLQIYLCAALPDAEMSDPKYVEQHGIVTCRMPILLQHRTAGADLPVEYNDIVIETKTLSHEDWKRTYLLAWAVQAFHCLALTQFIAIYLHEQHGCPYMSFYEAILAYAEAQPRSWCGQQLQQAKNALLGALRGGSWDVVLPQFGDCVWPTEEATFLVAVGYYEKVCGEIWHIVKNILGYSIDSQIFAYQKFMIKNPYLKGQKFLKLESNLHSFFHGVFEQKPVLLRTGRFVLCLDAEEGFSGDLQRFAQQVVWYGRKGGTTKYTTVTEHEVL